MGKNTRKLEAWLPLDDWLWVDKLTSICCSPSYSATGKIIVQLLRSVLGDGGAFIKLEGNEATLTEEHKQKLSTGEADARQRGIPVITLPADPENQDCINPAEREKVKAELAKLLLKSMPAAVDNKTPVLAKYTKEDLVKLKLLEEIKSLRAKRKQREQGESRTRTAQVSNTGISYTSNPKFQDFKTDEHGQINYKEFNADFLCDNKPECPFCGRNDFVAPQDAADHCWKEHNAQTKAELQVYLREKRAGRI